MNPAFVAAFVQCLPWGSVFFFSHRDVQIHKVGAL